LEPVAVTKSRFAQGKHELLVNWKGMAIADVSWLDLEEFRRLYLAFQLEDKPIVQRGRDVIWGMKYE
jgi:hypothetical protein